MKTIIDKFTPEEKKLMVSVINRLGHGEHPMATVENLYFFTKSYMRDLLGDAISKLSKEGNALAKEIFKKLK